MADTTETATVHTVEVVRYDDPVVITERVAVSAFIAGYTDPTRRSYATDLRIFAGWCHDHDINLLNVKRPHLETFARWMEQEGRMASTIGRRLSTLSSFYRYCQTEDILDKNPALNVRRPKVHDESRTLGLDRNELGALLVQAGLGDLRDGAMDRPPDHHGEQSDPVVGDGRGEPAVQDRQTTSTCRCSVLAGAVADRVAAGHPGPSDAAQRPWCPARFAQLGQLGRFFGVGWQGARPPMRWDRGSRIVAGVGGLGEVDRDAPGLGEQHRARRDRDGVENVGAGAHRPRVGRVVPWARQAG